MWNYQSDAAVPGAVLGNPVGVGSSPVTDAQEVVFEAPTIDVTDVMGEPDSSADGEDQS